MGVSDYIKVLRKRWMIIALCAAVGLALAAGLVQATSRVYTASAQIFVAASSTAANTTSLNNGNTFAQARVQSYTSVASSPDVTQAVVNNLKLGISSGKLGTKVSADAPLNKVLLNIHVKDHSPVQAARLANAVAAQFVTYVEDIEKLSAGSDESPVRLTVIHPAVVPSSPTSPKAKVDLVLGLLIGLIVGLAFAALREALDTRVRTMADVADESSASVLAVVPADKRAAVTPVAFRGDERSQRAEAFRQLRANLQYIDVDHPPKLISVTSAMSSEGKSSVAINLASALAEAGMTVCLIDADLRRPTVAKVMGLVSGAGLTSVLAGNASIGDVLQSVGLNLNVITSGPIPPNPSELLASAQFRAVLNTLSAQTDFVVIDSAPLLPVADGLEVAQAADVNLLVVRSGRTTRDHLRQAIGSLDRVGAKLGGIVMNGVSTRDSGAYYAYYTETPGSSPRRSSRHEAPQPN